MARQPEFPLSSPSRQVTNLFTRSSQSDCATIPRLSSLAGQRGEADFAVVQSEENPMSLMVSSYNLNLGRQHLDCLDHSVRWILLAAHRAAQEYRSVTQAHPRSENVNGNSMKLLITYVAGICKLHSVATIPRRFSSFAVPQPCLRSYFHRRHRIGASDHRTLAAVATPLTSPREYC